MMQMQQRADTQARALHYLLTLYFLLLTPWPTRLTLLTYSLLPTPDALADAQAPRHSIVTPNFLLLTPYALADAQAPRHSIMTPNFLLLSRCAGPCLSLLSPYFLRPTPTPDS